jgi:prepilin-type processing-associated H-X9-DG protein
VAWSQDDDGLYPLPSRFDPDHKSETFNPAEITTRSIDRTGNVWSLLIYNKVLNTDVFISPAETNVNIRKPKIGYDKEHSEYHYAGPLAAPTASQFDAVYDPQYKGSASVKDDAAAVDTSAPQLQTPREVGHNSYAHATLAGARLATSWNTFTPSPILPVVGNRGPVFENVYPEAEPQLNAGPYSEAGIRSLTLGIHGGKSTWEGNVAYNDGHTELLTKPNPEGQRRIEFGNEDVSLKIADNIFVDEEIPGLDPAARNNSYLRIWSKGLPNDSGWLNGNGPSMQFPDRGYYMWVDGGHPEE